MYNCVEGTSWKLRMGQPQLVCGCPCTITPDKTFIIQTFGVEVRTVKNYKATTEILESKDFIGLNPEAEYESASYNGTQYISTGGEVILTGQENKIPEYVDESEMPGVENFEFS
jgi:hypothetical protein